MARQRKTISSNNGASSKSSDLSSTRNENSSTSSTGTSNAFPTAQSKQQHHHHHHQQQKNSTASSIEKHYVVMTKSRIIIGSICLAIVSYFCYLGYLETRVNTPFDFQKMVKYNGLDETDKYWGSYRPGTYFGMKTRDPHSPVMGLMWYSPMRLRSGGEGLRHWCEIGDNLDKYGWQQHDGKTFGIQEIYDYPFKLETSFVKVASDRCGGDWTARINVTDLQNQHSASTQKNNPTKELISIIWYTALEEKTEGKISIDKKSQIFGVTGQTTNLGDFTVKIHEIVGTVTHQSYLSTVTPNLKVLREIVTSQLYTTEDERTRQRVIALPGDVLPSAHSKIQSPNFIATLITAQIPFTIDIAYHTSCGRKLSEDINRPPIDDQYTEILARKRKEFSKRFEKTYRLAEKGYSESDVQVAEAALSNMIGSIGYFYGSSRVQSHHTKEPVPYWKAPLYTGVPSRSFFPRGFLWDEGFHGLLIATWDIDIELDIICHWFDLMNVEGWIPREQILGIESLAKVPDEFVTQRNTNANPPTFFLTLKLMLSKYGHLLLEKDRSNILERLYPRLQTWFAWYNTTQKGEAQGTYRWRGRDPDNERELNPKTLTSGLDDYPRASHPTDTERHIDLRCWIAFAAGVMADLANLLGHYDNAYWETHFYLSDNTILNELHLSPYTETYSDWGLHTDSVTLKLPPPPKPSPGNQRKKNMDFMQQQQQQEKIRVHTKNPEYRFIDSTYGYVSLFPFLLEILTPDSQSLGKILTDIRNPNILWTDYGLRSLSKSSPFYMKRNTDHDPPYWRGQIWININYLTLKSLYHYGTQPGPYSSDAKRLYVELRHNIVTNIIYQYKRTGYIWEQYNDKTGEGSGCKPFTGWSALFVLIMSENY